MLLSILATAVLLVTSREKAAEPSWSEEPVVVGTFDDGSVFEVLKVDVGRLVEGRLPGPLPAFGFRLHGSSTYARAGAGYSFDVTSHSEGGREVAHEARASTGAPLMLLVRLRGPGGAPVSFSAYRAGSAVTIEGPGGGSFDRGRALNELGDEPESWRRALHVAKLPLLAQHFDPDVGWIHIDGPFPLTETLPDRHVLVLQAWRRDQPSLKFRVIRADGSSAEFTLPNPASPAASPSAGLGAKFVAADIEMELKSVTRIPMPCRHPLVAFETDIRSASHSVGEKRWDQIWPVILGASDEAGNNVPIDGQTHRGKYRSGFFLPQAAGEIVVLYHINRRTTYPRDEGDCEMVAEGKVAPDGKRMTFRLLPGAAKLGIEGVDPSGVRAPGEPDLPADWLAVDLKVEGALTKSRMKAIESRLGPPERWELVVFAEGEAASSGCPEFRVSSSGTSFANHSFSHEYRWHGPLGALQPGKAIRVGLTPKLPPGIVMLRAPIPAEKAEP